jgi:hypothetical protein
VAGVLVLGAALTRIPILVGPQTYMDGDEALMGLVVLHALQGGGIPLFPYGAEFGLSFLETGVGVVFASVFGLSEVILNASIFALWCAGAACLVAAVARFVDSRAALWAAMLSVATPAWLHFSNISWGYYHSAFLFCHASLLLVALVVEEAGPRRGTIGLLGLLASLTYYTQPIFALGLLPFLGWLALRRRRPDDIVILAAGFAVCTIGYYLVRNPEAYWAPTTFANVAVLESLAQMPRRLWVNATGVYFLNRQLELGTLTKLLSLGWVVLVASAGTQAAWNAVRSRRIDVSVVALASIVVIVGFSLVVDRFQWGYRYLVPTVGFEVLLVARELHRRAASFTHGLRAVDVGAAAMVGVAILLSVTEVSRTPGFSGTSVAAETLERDAVRASVAFLEEEGVRHVYAWDGMLQWKLMFESRGRILARWIYRTDRIPEYPAAVDRAFAEGARVAIFGELTDLEAVRRSIADAGAVANPLRVSDYHFVVLDPPRDLVEATFRLNE